MANTNHFPGHSYFGDSVRVSGNLSISGDVTIGGWLDAPNVKSPCRGLFLTPEDLMECCPRPFNGQYAFVGSGFPAEVYVASDRRWQPSGGTSPDITVVAPEPTSPEPQPRVLPGSFGILADADSLAITFCEEDADGSVSHITLPLPLVSASNAGILLPSDKALIHTLRDDLEQLASDLGEVETAAGNAQTSASQAIELAQKAAEDAGFHFLEFNGFTDDDAGYSLDASSDAPAVSIRFHTLYNHFEATVRVNGRSLVVKQWKDSDRYNFQPEPGVLRPHPSHLFKMGGTLYAYNRSLQTLQPLCSTQ